MTENEIIEILQTEKACVTRAMKNECNRDCYNCDLCEEGKDILTVYDAVINALDEIQQYRAIGTVKEIKIREAQFARLSEGYLNDLSLLREYQAIGTIEEFKSLKEKEKQGLLLRLPCKVGDTVYVKLASYCESEYAEAEVRDFTHFISCGFCVVVTSKHFDKQAIPFTEFGKTIFLTKEEAEQASENKQET